MQYFTIPPPKILAHYVRHFWVLECEVSPGDPFIHRTMADGCPELLFHYKGRFDRLDHSNENYDCFTSGMQGQAHEFKRFWANRSFGLFGVYLFPYAIPELFGMPATEMANQMPDLQSLLGKDAASLEENMILAADTPTRMAIICNFLEQKLPHNSKAPAGVKETIGHIIQTKGMLNVAELASRNFLSTRQFERHFKTMSGFSPKLFSRIVRFQSALYENKAHKSLTEIAYDCGYYDQSHFIHDFRTFSGHHPMHYFSGKAEGAALVNL